MAKTKKCQSCGTDIITIEIKPIGFLCSKCIDKAIDTMNKALDKLYPIIYKREAKIIMERLNDTDFDLEDYIENHSLFSDEIMFRVVTDMMDAETNKDVILQLMDGARIKSLGMEFVDVDERK